MTVRKTDLAALKRFDPAAPNHWRKIGPKLAERLEAAGLVELLPRHHDTTRNRVGRLTDAGRAALADGEVRP